MLTKYTPQHNQPPPQMELNHYYDDDDDEEEEEEEDDEDEDEDENSYYYHYYDDYQYNSTKFEAEADWFTKLVLLQGELIHNALSFIFSPVVFLMSVLSHSYHKAEETSLAVRTALRSAPFRATRGLALLLRRVGLGLFGAAHVCVVLVVVLAFSVVLGVGLVQIWVEHDPVLVKERLRFDYAEVCPKAVFVLEKRKSDVPVGHTFSVSVLLFMPESGFNRDIGVFQISAELLSRNGHVMAKSSLPCMLRFRSLPVRLARTFILSVPLLLGISDETQKIGIDQLVKHREAYPRTEAIRITMVPRTGTALLPQIYEAEIVLKSKLPWTRDLVRRWKWTLYVWTSLYIYIVLVIALLYFCRPIFFPVLLLSSSVVVEGDNGGEVMREGDKESSDGDVEDEEVSEFVRKWRLRRGKRKTVYLEGESSTVGSSASSLTVSREETSCVGVLEEEEEEEVVGDSESSVC